MKCSSCNQARELNKQNSKLMTGMRLWLCSECSNMEPRWLIVIYGRQNGLESIRPYIASHRYIGTEISARELV